jgi:hypothetical protein
MDKFLWGLFIACGVAAVIGALGAAITDSQVEDRCKHQGGVVTTSGQCIVGGKEVDP